MTQATTSDTAPAARPGSTRRAEIQGLRGLAVVLVVVYHVWVGRVSGGVDVFLVLSGFFMVGQFARRADGPLDVTGYWRRTAGRIVPPAMVVLVGTMLATVLFLPQARWPQTLQEVLASAFFVENWRLAADAVDYYAANNVASVVQQYWSLSIQGQFYLLFPLVIALVVAGARAAGRSARAGLAVALIAVSAASLAYSVWLTGVSQQVAYFDSSTRLWEFTLGGLLALAMARVSLPRAARLVVGWLGVLGLVSCGVVLDVAGGFPGYLALWPVAATVMIIVAGRTESPFGADRLLSSRPARYLGDLSFSLYLWHWPVLVLALVVGRRAELGPLSGSAVIATALALAVGTRHLVEVPLRRRRDRAVPVFWSDHRLAVAAVAMVGVLLVGWNTVLETRSTEAVAVADPDHPGAASRLAGYVDTTAPDASLLPSELVVGNDWQDHLIGACRPGRSDPLLVVCEHSPGTTPTRRVMVIGDSHAQQFLPALFPTAEARGWSVTSTLMARCPFSQGPSPEPDCERWNDAALAEVDAIRPDVVIVHASHLQVGGVETTPPRYIAGWQALDRLGIPVLAVRDNPRYLESPTACLLNQYADDASCASPRQEALPEDPSYAKLPSVPPNVDFLDFSDLYCLRDVCPPAIGNVLIYMDDNHVTASYSRTMAPALAQQMNRALGW